MCNGFYKTNNEILKIDPLKISDNLKSEIFKNNDILDFYFNHWIMRKENNHRTMTEYKKGEFTISYYEIQRDFNLTLGKAQRLMKRFLDKGIITLVHRGEKKGDKSVYAYTTVYYENDVNLEEKTDKVSDKVTDKVKRLNINGSNSQSDNETIRSAISSKKNNKKEYIYNAFTKIFELWNSKKIVKHKKINESMIKAYEKALKVYKDNEMVEAIENYSEILESDFYYSHKFTLENFLKQSNGIGNFVTEGQIYINYLENKKVSAVTDTRNIKKLNYNQSICSNGRNYTRKMEVL